jgi:hypothetical protein
MSSAPAPAPLPSKHTGWLRHRYTAWIAGVLLIGITLCYSSYYLTLPGVNFSLKHEDDVQYYLKIADNFAAGYPFTFDRLNCTNGFHPLWVLVLLPLCLATSDPETLVRLAFITQYLLFLASAVLLYILLLQITGRQVIVSLAIALYYAIDNYFYKTIVNGLETPLFVLLLFGCALAYMRCLQVDRVSWKLALGTGLLTTLLILSRLEAGAIFAFGCGLLMLYLLYRRRLPLPRAAGWFAVAITPALIFAALSAAYTGSPIPVSGQAKRLYALGSQDFTLYSLVDFPMLYNWETHLPTLLARKVGASSWAAALNWPQNSYYVQAPGYILFGLLLAGTVYAIYLLLRWWRPKDEPRGLAVITTIALCALALVVFNKLIYRGGIIAYWYPVSFSVAQLLMLAYIAGRLRGRWLTPPVCVLALACAGFFLYEISSTHHTRATWLQQDTGYTNYLAAAEWLESNTPPDTVAASYNAGIIGFYSERRVINLDGLVNSHEYCRTVLAPRAAEPALARRRLLHYLHEHNVRYFADIQQPGDTAYWQQRLSAPEYPVNVTLRFESQPGALGFTGAVYELTWPAQPPPD